MRTVGWLLLVSGWMIVLAAFPMLSAFVLRVVFVVAGLATQGLGLMMLSMSFAAMQRKSA